MNDFKLRVLKSVTDKMLEVGRDHFQPSLYVKLKNGKHKIIPVPGEFLATPELKSKLKEVLICINKTVNSECCCFIVECTVGGGESEKVKDALTPEEFDAFKKFAENKGENAPANTDMGKIMEKVKKASNTLDGIFFQFEHSIDETNNEFMAFEVLEDGRIMPYNKTFLGYEEIKENMSSRFLGLYEKI